MGLNPATSYRAVLIGIDDYPQKPLSGCVNDIDQIESILLDRLGVPPERITRFAAPRAGASASTRLPSLSPTLDGIRYGLYRLAEEVGKDDLVFIYYSGHGSQAMTRWNGHSIAREALLPLDYWNDGGDRRLLYDFELNSLFTRLAGRAGDLTVVLDCCHSASATREDLDPEDTSRYLPICEVQDIASQIPPDLLARDSSGFFAGLESAGNVHMLVAACRASELAYEVAPGGAKPSQGAFSRALVEILEKAERPLSDLQWSDIWTVLLDRVGGFNSWQHPQLIGRGERLLFGGPWTWRDPGYVIRQDGERFRIEAGTLTGLSEGAEVAVYGPEPDRFPALDSSLDRSSRIGLLRVDRADRSSCTAVSANGGLRLPPGARGRLVRAGQPDRLTVALEPFDPRLAARLEARGIAAVPPGTQGIEACLHRDAKGRFHLGDEIYGDGRTPSRPPLASFTEEHPDTLEAVLGHYARYRQALRLPSRCTDLPGALRVELLDCRNTAVVASQDLQAPSSPQLPIDIPWNYKVQEGEGFAIRIDNRAYDPLNVFVFNCTGSGRVENLGHVEVPAGSLQILWREGILGSAFYPARGVDRPEIVDRLVIVGTTLPDRDLRHLELDESLAEVIRRPRECLSGPTRSASGSPVEQWTAEMITLRIYR
jgi:hypothetical protein